MGNSKKSKPLKTLRHVAPQEVGLPKPGQAITPPPAALVPVAGALRVRGKASELSPYGARAERFNVREEVIAQLLRIRPLVIRGTTLVDAVCDGTILGWRTRAAVESAMSNYVGPWEQQLGRTIDERLVIIDRALALYGHVKVKRHGGWSVGR